ncbi:MAG: hypothetical protein KDB27_29440, partial [Planctomycetales bacterium]|nr:hypothetical protein [Planctomycetales bacterium]
VDHIPKLIDGTAIPRPQPAEGVSYYPKRQQEDGLIYWTDGSNEIYNLVRAVTHPFHGAFSFLDDDPSIKITIWQLIPFDTHLIWPDAKPGEITEVFGDGSFIVRTGDTSVLIEEYDGIELGVTDVGRRFGHLSLPRKEWKDLPR